MRVFVFVNQIEEIGYRQTTALLIASFVRQKHHVFLANVDALAFSATGDQAFACTMAKEIPFAADCQSEDVEAFAKSTATAKSNATAPARFEPIEAGDVIMIRTNPGRDASRVQIHESFLHLCAAAESTGVRVINSPQQLRYFASKSSLVTVDPKFRPAMIVTNEPKQILDFINCSPVDCVAKPLFGSRGENVIRVSKSNSDLEQTLSDSFGDTTLVVQQIVDADHPGDKRVVVLDGEILEVDGHLAGIERHPASNDFRANLHAGGSAHDLTLSPTARSAAQYGAELLAANGIRLAGVDLIGDRIIEFNVFSTGGLYDAIRFSDVRFDDVIAERLLPTSP
jgi:glutathione synthase